MGLRLYEYLRHHYYYHDRMEFFALNSLLLIPRWALFGNRRIMEFGVLVLFLPNQSNGFGLSQQTPCLFDRVRSTELTP